VAETAAQASSSLGAEAVELLGRLLAFDTSNPPGNERPAQEMLAAALTDAGVESTLVGAEPSRPNLVARISGERDGPTLCLLGHCDTVPADPAEWSFDPWAGDVVGGEVRGRGAQDMKGQVAVEVAAVCALGREGWRPERGTLLLVVTVDEEAGALGARWLCEERPELVRCDYVVNEGGGVLLEHAGKRLFPVAMGEKGVFRFLLRAHGTAGHASLPRMGDNALLKLAPYLSRLRADATLEPAPEVLALLAALGEDLADFRHGGPIAGPRVDEQTLRDAVERVRSISPVIADYLLEPMMSVTMTPTMASASAKENVIPSVAEVLVDTRVPPERGEEEVRREIRRILGPAGDPAHDEDASDISVEFVDRTVGNRSSPDTELFDAIAAWVARADPEADVVPMFMPGFSDSHWFREFFDAVAYGFWPRRAMPFEELEPLIHGSDERVKAADIELSAGFFHELPRLVLG
jgi:acetylornithine deacetylase/succinyl-diaminopimelate desuccinylase-like protein